MDDLKCCVTYCEKPLDQNYWDSQYQTNTTGWDLGVIATPLKHYIDGLTNKAIRILIPGCGNSYEAEYLVNKGFTNVTVIDIAPTLVENLKMKFSNNPNIAIVLGDFFDHQGEYDLILEQTFFCALPPTLRQKYVWKMHQLLSEKGLLSGLLFNRSFETGPPFGGSKAEYEKLFQISFSFNKLDLCLDSNLPRANSELFFEFQKNNKYNINLYQFQGITCTGCMQTVTEKFSNLNKVLNVSMSSDFETVLIVSDAKIDLEILQNEIAYDAKYKIIKIN
jgi:SAM-dependent methyltransferase